MKNRRKVVKIEINLLFDKSRESIKNAPLRKIYDQTFFFPQISSLKIRIIFFCLQATTRSRGKLWIFLKLI